MSECAVGAVAKLTIELDIDSTSSVTLRVKPDRRKAQMYFEETLERRLASTSARLTKAAIQSVASPNAIAK
jgi:hypothetical protein